MILRCATCSSPVQPVLLLAEPKLEQRLTSSTRETLGFRFTQDAGVGFRCPNGHDQREHPPVFDGGR